MLKKLARLVFGGEHASDPRILKDLAAINALSDRMTSMSDDAMREMTSEFQRRIDGGEKLDGRLKHEAFALVREAAWRVLGKRPYDVQIVGGLALHDGMVAEMRTGEGKTLTAAMPTYLNALSGKGVHVITVNDYLAARDAEQIGRVHRFLGLTVGVVVSGMEDPQRRAAYACDVTYGTNTEIGFDYLRDNLRFERSQMVQRGHNFAIADEVDSVLIDEARTPMIISAPFEDGAETYVKVDAIVARLVGGRDFVTDERLKAATLTEQGTVAVERMLVEDGLLAADTPLYAGADTTLVHHVNAALRARALFQKDRDYVVRGGEVVLVDANTGRLMEGRRFSEGIHQALEAREGVPVQNETRTLTSITYQNFFRLYAKLSGMTGTAATERAELAEVYGLDVTVIPTHRPLIRVDEPDEVHLTEKAKLDAIVKAVYEARYRKQPVLIGTASIEKSASVAAHLARAGFVEGDFAGIKEGRGMFQVLNAHNHRREAEIIAQAGIPGAITIATNMAGRGTDIELGGSFEARFASEAAHIEDEEERRRAASRIEDDIAKARGVVLEAGGLLVIGTERHESRRVDNQLRGRAGRQGDPGRSRFYVSLEDEVARVFGSDKLRRTAATLGLREGDAISHPLVSRLLEGAQRKVEERNYAIRKDVVKFDDVNDAQRRAIHAYRQEIMDSANVDEIVAAMREQAVEAAFRRAIPENSYPENWDLEGLEAKLLQLTSIAFALRERAAEEGVAEEELLSMVEEKIAVFEAERRKAFEPGVFEYSQKHVLLQVFDTHWREHLAAMEELKAMIGLRSYAQRDPIVEYRTDAQVLFENMLKNLGEEVATLTSRLRWHPPVVQPGLASELKADLDLDRFAEA
jgi:preprotein translocase subunit SecA